MFKLGNRDFNDICIYSSERMASFLSRCRQLVSVIGKQVKRCLTYYGRGFIAFAGWLQSFLCDYLVENYRYSVKTLQTQNRTLLTQDISAQWDWCRSVRTDLHPCRTVLQTFRHCCRTVSISSKHFCYSRSYRRKV